MNQTDYEELLARLTAPWGFEPVQDPVRVAKNQLNTLVARLLAGDRTAGLAAEDAQRNLARLRAGDDKAGWIERALRFIPSDGGRVWRFIGKAVKHELGDGGFDIWDAWSSRGARYNAVKARAVWRGYEPNGKVTIGTIYREAQRHGFKPITHKTPKQPRMCLVEYKVKT
jgi:hypothetical protein